MPPQAILPRGRSVLHEKGWGVRQDGINNDPGQDPDPGLIDFDGGLSALGYVASDPDPQCVGLAWKNKESTASCGLGGFELALILPGLMWLHRRRRRLH